MNVSQVQFQAAMLAPDAATPEGLRNPDGSAASKRFDVYRNNVVVSLADALETAFPVVRKLVGDAFFRAMAAVYLRQHPPTSPLMMFYGEAMPAFLADFYPAKSLPYLPDIARLELALRHSYHAADGTPVDHDALGQLTPEALMRARLHLAPAVRLLSSDYPIHSIYVANTQPDAPNPAMQAERILITRPEFDPQLHLISATAHACINALAQQKTLEDAMRLVENENEFSATLGLLLAQGAVVQID